MGCMLVPQSDTDAVACAGRKTLPRTRLRSVARTHDWCHVVRYHARTRKSGAGAALPGAARQGVRGWHAGDAYGGWTEPFRRQRRRLGKSLQL